MNGSNVFTQQFNIKNKLDKISYEQRESQPVKLHGSRRTGKNEWWYPVGILISNKKYLFCLISYRNVWEQNKIFWNKKYRKKNIFFCTKYVFTFS